jgi:diacylglycerol kinase family enzyme
VAAPDGRAVTAAGDRPVAVVLNAGAGEGGAESAAARVRERFAAAGRPVQVSVCAGGDELRARARDALAAGCSALVGGGGDGTLSGLAALVAGTAVPFGVLPLGTLNHFARDLGVPLDLDAALDVVLAGRVAPVDVGEVNGRVFLNNSSLGVYPRVVRLRERLQREGERKWVALLWASLAVLRRHPFVAVRLDVEGAATVRRTPLVLIGNNAYRMEGLHAASRPSLAGGELAVYVMNAVRRRSLLALGFRVLLRGADAVPELETLRVPELVVETRRRHIQVALDGEVADLATPLHYRIRPGALRVFSPENAPGAAS